MANSPYPGPAVALELFEALVAGNPMVERKGAKNPYTSRNGHMFSFLDAEGTLALRMSPEVGDEFCDRYDSGPVEQHGRTMQGYLWVPAELLAQTDELQPWFDRSHEWIGTLKPKSTKRAKKTAKVTKKKATKKKATKKKAAKKKAAKKKAAKRK